MWRRRSRRSGTVWTDTCVPHLLEDVLDVSRRVGGKNDEVVFYSVLAGRCGHAHVRVEGMAL